MIPLRHLALAVRRHCRSRPGPWGPARPVGSVIWDRGFPQTTDRSRKPRAGKAIDTGLGETGKTDLPWTSTFDIFELRARPIRTHLGAWQSQAKTWRVTVAMVLART